MSVIERNFCIGNDNRSKTPGKSNKDRIVDFVMAVLETVAEFYPVFMIMAGVMGIIMGWDRIWQSDEEESKTLQIVAVVAGILLTAEIILAIYYEDTGITKYSVVFGIFFGLSLFAKPLRKVPIAFAVTAIAGLSLSYFVIDRGALGDETFFGQLELRVLVVIILIIMVLVFIISFIQEQTMDILLLMLSWGVLVIVLAVAMILQGITLLLDINDPDGILGYLPG